MRDKLDHDDPLLRRIVMVAATTMTVTSGALALMYALQSPVNSLRIGPDLLLMVAGLAALALYRKNRLQAAIGLVIVAYFSIVVVDAFLSGGVRGPTVINFPLIIILTGWLVGGRPALIMAFLCEAAIVALILGDAAGLVRPADYGGRDMQFMFYSVVISASAMVALYSRRGYLASVEEAMTVASQLAESEAELRHHRDRLEEIVAERTRDLEKARAEAERLMQVKSEFLANMSHEIRTPMNAILGFAGLLRSEATTPEQVDRLDKLNTAGEHLLTIIDDILDLSKIEAGKLELERINYPFGTLLDQVRSLVADTATRKGLVVTVDNGDMPFWLKGDPTRLRQALLNYASNAIKFTDRGIVSLSARVIKKMGDELLVRFEVLDTGIGIPRDKLPTLFQSFEQADNSTTRKYGGTGLGLAITQRVANLMGGEVGVESAPGEGSLFWITARFSTGYAATAEEGSKMTVTPADIRRVHAGARVLLVEDDPINREVALAVLEHTGLVVDQAEDGLRALKMASKTAYDLILMDMQMPVMDGLETTLRIREIPKRRHVSIVAMTANATEEDRKRCLAAGMNDFIAKPVRPGRLFELLMKWLPSKAGGIVNEGASNPGLGGQKLEVPRLLSGIPGVDPAAGLESVLGIESTYVRMLRSFSEKRAGDAMAIRTCVDAGDLGEARRLAHSLKGTSATLGLGSTRRRAEALEQALADPAGRTRLASLLDELEQELADIAAALRLALKDVPEG